MILSGKNIHNEQILVTGATGMIGSRLVYDLLLTGAKVRAIYRDRKRIAQFETNIGYYTNDVRQIVDKVEWVQADVTHYASLLDALQGVNLVYHCAAMVSFHKPDRAAMYEVNIYGTRKLVDACIETKVAKFCHVSSVAALGRTGNGSPVNEETGWLPGKKHTGYSIAKYHSEMEVWRGMHEGLQVLVVNPSVVLGPGDWNSGSPAFYNQVYKGLKFYTRGITGFVDVRDVTKAMLLLSSNEHFEQAKAHRYLLSAANLSYKEIFDAIARSLKVKAPRFEVKPGLMGMCWRVAVSFAWFTGKKPLITRESTQNATRKTQFDGTKISRDFPFQYRSISETIHDIGQMYLSEV